MGKNVKVFAKLKNGMKVKFASIKKYEDYLHWAQKHPECQVQKESVYLNDSGTGQQHAEKK